MLTGVLLTAEHILSHSQEPETVLQEAENIRVAGERASDFVPAIPVPWNQSTSISRSCGP